MGLDIDFLNCEFRHCTFLGDLCMFSKSPAQKRARIFFLHNTNNTTDTYTHINAHAGINKRRKGDSGGLEDVLETKERTNEETGERTNERTDGRINERPNERAKKRLFFVELYAQELVGEHLPRQKANERTNGRDEETNLDPHPQSVFESV